MKSLADKLDEYPEAWRAQPGDKLIGTVVGVDRRTSAFDDELYAVVTIEVEEGSTEDGQALRPGTERAFHGFHTVPRNELRKLRPRPGERIGVAYHGKGNKSYERYRLVIDRRTPQIDWDELGGGEDVAAGTSEGRDAGAEVKKAAEADEGDDIPF